MAICDFMARFFAACLVLPMLSACGGGGDDIIPASGSVTVRITVAALPATVTYNRAANVDGVLEYEWGVAFDVNDDGLINTGDIVLNLSHYKEAGAAETSGSVSGFAARAWLYTTDTVMFLIPGDPLNVSISGNDITLSINRVDFTNLVGVNATTKVHFKAAYWDPSLTTPALTYDYYKDLAATVNEPSGIYTDDAGADDSDVIDPTITLNPAIDMQTMQLTFTD